MRGIFLAVLVAASPVTDSMTNSDKPSLMSESFFLSPSQVDVMRLEAAGGDPEAAFRLSLHFSMGHSASKEDARFWRLIAAENGHSVAQYNIWFFDHESRDELLRTRALFWLRRSAASGYDGAKEKLNEIEKDLGDKESAAGGP